MDKHSWSRVCSRAITLRMRLNRRKEVRWIQSLLLLFTTRSSKVLKNNSTCPNTLSQRMDQTALTIGLLLVKSLPSQRSSCKSNSTTQLAALASKSRLTRSKNKRTKTYSKTRSRTNAQPFLAILKMSKFTVSTTRSARVWCKTIKCRKVWCTKIIKI